MFFLSLLSFCFFFATFDEDIFFYNYEVIEKMRSRWMDSLLRRGIRGDRKEKSRGKEKESEHGNQRKE